MQSVGKAGIGTISATAPGLNCLPFASLAQRAPFRSSNRIRGSGFLRYRKPTVPSRMRNRRRGSGAIAAGRSRQVRL
jgi:hypothetical protein